MNIRLTIFLMCLLGFTAGGCKKFLDVVPDNVATIDYAFRNRTSAEQYLFTCFSYLPKHGNPYTNPAFSGANEFWYFYPYAISGYPLNQASWEITRGNQSVTTPLTSYWTGSSGAPNLFKGIRDCNIFLENIHQVQDMDDYEKDIWASETVFLKAYYHFWLLRMYGPIPIVDKNLPINADQAAVQVERMTIDSCFSYVVNTLDSAMAHLPETIQDQTTQMGRITRAIALSVKAQALVTAASPLFNGNTTYASFRNKAGQPFFNQTNDVQKWVKAADACKAAIDQAHINGHTLNKFLPAVGSTLPPELQVQMDIRTAVTDNFNEEVIWGNTNSNATDIQSLAQPRPSAAQGGNTSFYSMACVPLNIVNLFYTKNGVPATEDKTLNVATRGATTRVATDADKYRIFPGYTTAAINFDREPRFYADLGFDGSILYGNGNQTITALNHLEARQGQYSGWQGSPNNYNITGYWPVKVLNYMNTLPSATTYIISPYAWPSIRLADLYLMYSEALNEINGPTGDALNYINLVRARAGLPTVEDAWTNFSSNPGKYTNKEGMRDIIHRERTIELAFEGQRFWDVRRWKEAERTLQEPIQAWNIGEKEISAYYQITTLFNRTFQVRDYFWPISENDLLINKNLVQNPGW